MSYTITRGQKRYEMSNHLGNVLAVVSDKTKSVCVADTVQYYTAEVLYAYDYSPFGAILPQRIYVADSTCTTVINYDTTYNSHYQVSFNVTTLLSPGQTIRLDNGAGTVKVLATYNAGYVTPFSYIAQILSNVSPAADGIQAVYAGGSTVTAYFSADSLGFDCGDVVRVYSGSTSLNTVSINCAVDSIFAVDTTIVCSSSDYRFGFNGMEKDNEVKGVGNSYDFGARIYDSRLGRFLSVDPLSSSYPWYTPYQFAGNMPIGAMDLDGLEPEYMITKQGRLTKPLITILNTVFDYKISRLEKTRWKAASFDFGAITLYKTVFYDYSFLGSDDERWATLIVHEQKHRDEVGNGLVRAITWYVGYGIDYALAGFNYFKVKEEKRAFGIEPKMEEFMSFKKGKALKLLQSDLDEEDKSRELRYIGLEYKFSKLNDKATELKSELLNFKGSNKQRRKIENQIKKINNQIKEIKPELERYQEIENKLRTTA